GLEKEQRIAVVREFGKDRAPGIAQKKRHVRFFRPKEGTRKEHERSKEDGRRSPHAYQETRFGYVQARERILKDIAFQTVEQGLEEKDADDDHRFFFR